MPSANIKTALITVSVIEKKISNQFLTLVSAINMAFYLSFNYTNGKSPKKEKNTTDKSFFLCIFFVLLIYIFIPYDFEINTYVFMYCIQMAVIYLKLEQNQIFVMLKFVNNTVELELKRFFFACRAPRLKNLFARHKILVPRCIYWVSNLSIIWSFFPYKFNLTITTLIHAYVYCIFFGKEHLTIATLAKMLSYLL